MNDQIDNLDPSAQRFEEEDGETQYEVTILTTFLCKYSILTGVQIIAFFDFILTLVWFVLMFVDKGLEVLYVIYFLLSILRVASFRIMEK